MRNPETRRIPAQRRNKFEFVIKTAKLRGLACQNRASPPGKWSN